MLYLVEDLEMINDIYCHAYRAYIGDSIFQSSPVSVTAYLPNTSGGREVLQLLKQAFDDGWLFDTIEDEGVDWAGVEHKTSIDGGEEE